MLTTGFQLAAARALVGMDQVTLADEAGLSTNTIRSMEKAAAGPVAGRAVNVQAVQRALEATGIEFLNHGQPGVRLRYPLTAALRSIAAYVARHADKAAWDGGKSVSDQQRTERHDKIRALGLQIKKLGDSSRDKLVNYPEFEELLRKLHALGWFPPNEMVGAVAAACSP